MSVLDVRIGDLDGLGWDIRLKSVWTFFKTITVVVMWKRSSSKKWKLLRELFSDVTFRLRVYVNSNSFEENSQQKIDILPTLKYTFLNLITSVIHDNYFDDTRELFLHNNKFQRLKWLKKRNTDILPAGMSVYDEHSNRRTIYLENFLFDSLVIIKQIHN